MHDEPVAGLGPQLAAEVLEGVVLVDGLVVRGVGGLVGGGVLVARAGSSASVSASVVSDTSTVWTPDGTDSSVTRSSPEVASCDATSEVSSVDASASYWSGESFWSDTACSVTSVYWGPGRMVGRGG